ncbi:hypothetical protein [Arthrobacter sp. M4]|uniref:hypothetical protein n=1 Tax=Arthrobacter sp. M4 TaxID=218160 RepID=UPI001CDC5BA5|nr:hypothetical protein [Arthrobacter sp. M4]MCA4135575.1 hypothetical protein [Arthrobacter sp. M4]
MNPDGSPQPIPHHSRPSAESALAATQTLFRTFVLTVLGSFFVYTLNVEYLWLSAILTVASIVLGVVVLVRTVQYKQSRLVLFGTISGLVVCAVMCLLLLVTAAFFNQFRDYQSCARPALTEQARSECQQRLMDTLPSGLR